MKRPSIFHKTLLTISGWAEVKGHGCVTVEEMGSYINRFYQREDPYYQIMDLEDFPPEELVRISPFRKE